MRIDDGITLLEAADYRAMPWKNGGGTTREIFARRRDDGSAFDWRLSIADVASDGPFSPFPGHARTILLLEGRGMRLRFDGAHEASVDAPFRPLDFDGAADTYCTLIDGPVRDFNIISARARVRHAWRIIESFPWRNDAGDGELALFALHGHCRAVLANGIGAALAPHSTLLVDDAARLARIEGAGEAHALLLRFLPAASG